MSSLKKLPSSIITAFLILLVSCTETVNKEKQFKTIDLKKTPLFHYAFMGSIYESPVNFVETWNREALKEIGINHIHLYSKGGDNPDDTLSKIEYSYSNNWKTLNYCATTFESSVKLMSCGTLRVSGKRAVEQIVFTQLYGVKKELKTTVKPIKSGFLLLHAKRDNHSDSTWVIGTFSQPKAIVHKIGNSIFSVELFLPEGSSKSEIIQYYHTLPMTDSLLGAAQCTVTFMSDGKPQRSFLLDEQFSQISEIREWTYTKNHCISTYREWTGTSITHDMQWHYGHSQLPEYATIDRNTYFYSYE